MPELVIRPYEDLDAEPVLALLATSLGKTVDDRYRSFFGWKHLRNPFGRSFMWVGEVDGRIVGFRAFLRWRFIDPEGGAVEAVRAVDTATHPDFQGLGVFRKLTLHGLEEMRPAGIAFVFNTPNDQSRPGYLKMGWRVQGRVPVKVRPRSLPSMWRMARARTAAEPWSLAAEVGIPVGDLGGLPDPPGRSGRRGLMTDRSWDFLRWRYDGCPSVASRAVLSGDGAVIVRFRQRGGAIECTIADVIGTRNARSAGASVRSAMRRAGADYAIAAAGTPVGGMVPTARLGPILTRRELSDGRCHPSLTLTLGDVELF